MQINRTAVIGAGTMGSQIAVHMANAGAEVILLDIVPEDAEDRSELAKSALQKLKQGGRAFTHPTHAKRIRPGNIEDDLDKVAEADWILEAVIEKRDVKRELYRKLDAVRQAHAIISSNTSTIPLKQLKEEQSESLQCDLCITHFFNPPRQMQLLELVTDARNDSERLTSVRDFIENRMGKTIVPANDTPGFIANRIGIYWMMFGLEQALRQNVSVERADAVLGKRFGFPKTGIFGLMDLVGIDLMLDITRSLRENLPDNDSYQQLDMSVSLLEEMVKQELIGNKGKGGFYRKTDDGKRQVYALKERYFRDQENVEDAAIKAASEKGLRAALEAETQGGKFANTVLTEMMRYSASLVPEIADNITDVDSAMQLGFNWEQGPFDMMDALGKQGHQGAAWLTKQLDADDKQVPDLLGKAAAADGFYKEQGAKRSYLTTAGGYEQLPVPEGRWKLADRVRGSSPVLQNDAARLWDIGDGVACLELTTKMDIMGQGTFDLVEQAIEKVKSDFAGLIIGDDDRHFSAGLNLRNILGWCEKKDWEAIEAIIKRGQESWRKLKYAPFPVVGCTYGKTLGGACELTLHTDAVQAHSESYIGLVEVNIGVVPGWGGCKEMLYHHLQEASSDSERVEAVKNLFTIIAEARPSGSAELARERLAMPDQIHITMHRDQVLADAKATCEKLAAQYSPPEHKPLSLPLGAVKTMLEEQLKLRKEEHKTEGHDLAVLEALAWVLSGGQVEAGAVKHVSLLADDLAAQAGSLEEMTLLALERTAFMALIQTKETQEKIKRVL